MFYEQVEGPESDGLRDLWFRKPKGYIIHRIRIVERDVSYGETPFSESAEHWYGRTYCYLTGTFNKDWIEWKSLSQKFGTTQFCEKCLISLPKEESDLLVRLADIKNSVNAALLYYNFTKIASRLLASRS